jgi:hypothetical protein
MSITSLIPDEQGIVHTATGRVCSFCGLPLTDPTLYWMLIDGELLLHRGCFDKLFVRLARDAHELDDPRYYERRRAGPP